MFNHLISPIIFDEDNNTNNYEGKYFYTNKGYLIKIVKYIDYENVIVEFVYNGCRAKTSLAHIKEGVVRNPNEYKEKYENNIYLTNEGYEIEVIDYISNDNVLVKFLYNGFIKNTRIKDVINGNVSNPYHPNQYGAFIGIGKYNFINNREVYNIWSSIFQRVNTAKAYVGVLISNDWHCFQNFAEWYYSKINILNPKYKYSLDKDIKQIGKYPKYYSSETCMIIPNQLNVFLSSIYRFKESDDTLPLGVVKRKSGNYQARYSIDKKIYVLGTRDNKEDAFELYRKAKVAKVKELAFLYYNEKAINKDDYVYIINHFNLLPYNN